MDWGWAFDGVNTTIPRNAGPECSRYLTWQRQIIEDVVVTSISVFVLHWIWKRLSPCLDPNEEHLHVLRQRYVEGKGGYFGNTSPPPLQSGGGEKSALLFNDNNNCAEVCDSKEGGACNVHFSLNSDYCIQNNGGQPGNGVAGTQRPPRSTAESAYQQQLRVNGDGEFLEGPFSAASPAMVNKIYVGKQVLLVLMTFVLGLELGFKFASRTVIYLLNPCHITTIMQIYLLAAKPSKFATAIFRIQMNYMNGPILAFIFPETDSRKIAMEVILYWAQHGLMFINSIYLLRLKHEESGVAQYSVPPLFDLSWHVFSYAWLMVYHFFVLVSLAIPSEVNLNHMLCPAVLDPFSGPNYRLSAIVHQAILCPLMAKTICFAFAPAEQLLSRRKRTPGDGGGGGMVSSNDSESSSLLVSSISSMSDVASPSTTSVTSSPSMEHPIQSLNRTEYLNLIDDSEGEEGDCEGLNVHQAPTLTPLKRQNYAGVIGGGGGGHQQSDVVFSNSANVIDKTFAGFLEKKQE